MPYDTPTEITLSARYCDPADHVDLSPLLQTGLTRIIDVVRHYSPSLLNTGIEPPHLLPDARCLPEREPDLLIHLVGEDISYRLAGLVL